MSAKATQKALSVREFFPLSELLDPESLDPYSSPHELKPFIFELPRSKRMVGHLSFVNPDFQYLPTAILHLRLCGEVSQILCGANPCSTTCDLRSARPEGEAPFCTNKCGAGVLQTQSAIWVGGQIVGYVRGPETPCQEFYKRNLEKLDESLREDLLRYREALAGLDQEIISRAVGRVARRLSRRCTLERRLKILRHFRRRLASVNTATEVSESAFLSLQALFGDIDICVYTLKDNEELELVNGRGPSYHLQPRFLKATQGQVGAAIHTNSEVYAPDLETDAKGFLQVDRQRPAQSALTIPMRWGADQARSALQLSSLQKFRFSKPDRQTAWAIADMASMARSRLVLLDERHKWEVRSVIEGDWREALVEAIAARADSLVEVWDAKRRLYRGLVEEVKTLAEAYVSAVRFWDESAQIMRFGAFSETGWTEQAKSTEYRPGEPSAGMHAFQREEPYYGSDVSKADYYKQILPDSQAFYIMPFRSRGKCVGVVSVDWKSTQPAEAPPHREELLRLIRQFEAVLAILDSREDAIQAKLVAALRNQRVRDNEQLATIANEITMSTKAAFGARGCSMFIVFPGENRAQLVATTTAKPPQPVYYQIGEGLTGWVLRNRRCLRLKDTANDEELQSYDPPLTRSQRFKEDVEYGDTEGRLSFLAAPMIGHDQLVGAIRLTIKNDLTEFTSDEETFLLQIAREMAATIKDAWDLRKAHEEILTTERELQHLHEIGLALAHASDLDTIIRRVLSEAISESGVKGGSVWVLRRTRDALELKANQGSPEEALPSLIALNNVINRSIDASKPISFDDEARKQYVNSVPYGPHRDYLAGLDGMIHVPIRLRNDCLGLMFLESTTSISNSGRTLEFLGMLGSFAAVAIQLAQANKDLLDTLERTRTLALGGAIAAGIAHQVNNKLGGLKALLSHLPDVINDPALFSEALKKLRGQAELLAELNDNLILAENPHDAAMEPVNLAHLVNDFIGSPEVPPLEDVQLRFDCQESVFIKANAVLLRAALFNLIQNAVKAMNDHGELHITLNDEAGRAVLSIQDTGKGMSPYMRNHCFDPFFSEETSKRRGLGLAAVKAVVDLHKAEISVESGARGTTFFLKFSQVKEAGLC